VNKNIYLRGKTMINLESVPKSFKEENHMKENAKKVFVGIIVLAGIAVVFACAIKLIQAQSNKDMVQSSETSGVNAPKENSITIEAKTNVPTTVTLDDGSKVQITEENWRNYWDETRVTAVKDTNGVMVPVPKGYSSSRIYKKVGDDNVYIERTVDSGFVIYEDTAEQSGEPEGEIQYTYPGTEAQGAVIIWANDSSSTVNSPALKTAQTTRNQYVWVPVYNVDDMYGVDSTGKKWGKTYNISSSVTEPTLYGSVSNGIYTKDDNNREPDVVTNYDNDKTLPAYITEEERNEINKEITSNYEKTIASIKKYGGFYIGRYETGNLGQVTAKVVKSNSDIHTQRWYIMYRKCKELKGNNENVITSMIYGSQWDRTLMWLMETGKQYDDIANNSTSWGNYSNATLYYLNGTNSSRKSGNTRIPTGSAEYTNANNIYDLGGNVWDWTLEANGRSCRWYRGGGCINGRRQHSSGLQEQRRSELRLQHHRL